MERKYSDALTPEDHYGYEVEVKKAKKGVNKMLEMNLTDTTKLTVNTLKDANITSESKLN